MCNAAGDPISEHLEEGHQHFALRRLSDRVKLLQKPHAWPLMALLAAFSCTVGVLAFRRSAVRELAMTLWVQTVPDIRYGTDVENVLDLMRSRVGSQHSRPAVVVFHGGAWESGSRYEMRDRVCRRYLAKGFIVANVEYRRGAGPASEDAVRALEWFFQNAASFGADPRKIVVTGESAGGQLALFAAFTSQVPVAAVVNFYGISDLGALIDQPFVRAALPANDTFASATRLSPLGAVRQGLCPVLSIHGSSDTLVPPEQTVRLTARLRQAGDQNVEEWFIPGGRHGLSETEFESAYQTVFGFLSRRGVLGS